MKRMVGHTPVTQCQKVGGKTGKRKECVGETTVHNKKHVK